METDINNSSTAQKAWYCIRAQPRRERLATRTLAQRHAVELCFPTIRYPKEVNRRQRTIEPLFPGYFFARFNAAQLTRTIKYTQGVSNIVSCGNRLIAVDPGVIQEIKSITHNDIMDLQIELPAIGQKVRIMSGIFVGERGALNKILPARKRAEVLLKILGQESPIEIPLHQIELGVRHPTLQS